MIGPSKAASFVASVVVSASVAAVVSAAAVVAASVDAAVVALLELPEQPVSPITAIPSANKTAADFFIIFTLLFLCLVILQSIYVCLLAFLNYKCIVKSLCKIQKKGYVKSLLNLFRHQKRKYALKAAYFPKLIFPIP